MEQKPRAVINFHIDWGIEKYHTTQWPLMVFCNIGELMSRNMGSKKKMIKSLLETGVIWEWHWPWEYKLFHIDIEEDTITLAYTDRETQELKPINKYVFFEEEVDWEHVWKYTDVIGTCPWIAVEVLWWRDWVAYYKDKNWDRHSVYSWELIPKDAMCKDGEVHRVKQVWDYDYEIIESLWHI